MFYKDFCIFDISQFLEDVYYTCIIFTGMCVFMEDEVGCFLLLHSLVVMTFFSSENACVTTGISDNCIGYRRPCK